MKNGKHIFTILLSIYFLLTPLFPLFSYIARAVSLDFKVAEFTLPLTLEQSENIEIPIKLENIGDSDWFNDEISGAPIIELGYKINSVGTLHATLLQSNVSGITASPDNFTDDEQKISITAPDAVGSYALEVVLHDKTNDAFITSSEPVTLNFDVIAPLAPDITSPEGDIEILSRSSEIISGLSTSDPSFKIKMAASDPVIEGTEHSAVVNYKLISSYQANELTSEELTAKFEGISWAPVANGELTLDKNINSDLVTSVSQTVHYYVVYQDNAGNQSQIYSKQFVFQSTAPTGNIVVDEGESTSPQPSPGGEGVFPEVPDSNIKIKLSAESNVPVTVYRMVVESEGEETFLHLQNADWESFDQPQTSNFKLLTHELPDVTDNYKAIVQFKNQLGQISEIYSYSFTYKKYDISPVVSISSGKVESEFPGVLIGGEMDLVMNIKNSGEDIGYNARLEVDLPRGFNLTPNPSPAGEGGPRAVGEVAPTYISTNSEGNQVLIFEGIDDLLQGETASVKVRLKVGGVADGYKLGDKVNFAVTGYLFKHTNFKTGFSTTSNFEVELKPFIVTNESTSNLSADQAGGQPATNNDILVGEKIDNEITVETGDLATDSPLIVQFELDNGIGYQEGTQAVLVNGSPAEAIFNVIESLDSNPFLQWILSGADSNSVIQILFQTELNKISDDSGLESVYVDHNEQIDTKIKVDGSYSNPLPAKCNNIPVSYPDPDCIPDTKTYTDQESSSITAKYFTVSKTADAQSDELQSGDKIRYTIRIETSKDYILSGIELTDTLPDGVDFNESSANISSSRLSELLLYSTSYDTATGEEILTWRINSAEGVLAGTTFEFSYDVTVSDNYDHPPLYPLEGGDLLASDILKSNLTLRGLWTDADQSIVRSEPVEERIENETVNTGNELAGVKFEKGIRSASNVILNGNEGSWTESVDARVGDIFDLYSLVTFPSNLATNDFKFRIYLPVGTKIIPDSLVISPTGQFSKDPMQYSPIAVCVEPCIGAGYLFDLGKVEKSSTFRIDYKLQVLDDANLKLATVVRNLFRADYFNVDNDKQIYRSDLTLDLIEPKLEVTKEKASGYFATGEEANMELRIKNTGTSTAYGVSIADSLPEGFQLLVVGNRLSVISNLGNEIEVIYDETTRQLRIENVDLQPEEEIIIVSELTTDNRLLFGQEVPTTVNISQYKNRGNEDPLPARTYPEEIHSFKFYAKESLLATFFTLTPSPSRRGEGEVVEIGRNKDYTLSANIEVVGGAPVYNVTGSLQLPAASENPSLGKVLQAEGVIEIDNIATYYINGNEIGTLDIVCNETECIAEIPPLSRGDEGGLTLYPNEILTLTLQLKTSTFAPLGTELPVTLTAGGENKLTEATRKDGSNETDRDYDNDDKSDATLKISKVDNVAPVGEITFTSPLPSLDGVGEAINATNNSVVVVHYTAWDLDSEVVGIRFSEDGINWMVDDGSLIPTGHDVMDEETRNLLGLEGDWNVYTSPVTRNTQLENEGLSYEYMQVVDLYGNVATIQNNILLDTTGPEFGLVQLSPFADDLSNPIYTALQDNFVNFYGLDACEPLTETNNEPASTSGGQPTTINQQPNCAGMGYYQYSTDLENWSDWTEMVSGVNSVKVSYPEIANGEKYNIYLRLKDSVGNIFERSYSGSDSCYSNLQTINESEVPEPRLATTILCDSIQFTTEIPFVEIVLNNNNEYTGNPKVDTKLNIIETPSGVTKIRYAASAELMSDAVWFEYYPFQNSNRTLDNYLNDGQKTLCVQLMDAAGKESNISCDSIILDTSAPNAIFLINNNELQTKDRDVVLHIAASDPQLSDGMNGIWGIKMKFSKVGEDCDFILDAQEATVCEQDWTNWENYSEEKNWVLDEQIGEQKVYLKLMDAVGNVSNVITASVVYNPLAGTGNILINNNDVFTNTRYVNLDLGVNMAEFNCSVCSRPISMRFTQTSGDNQPNNPPAINPDLNNLNGWSQWEEYPSIGLSATASKQWDLLSPYSNNEPASSSGGQPITNNYGLYAIHVQYLLPNGTVTTVYNDSIIYAPYYGVEYFSSPSGDDEPLAVGEVILETIPNTVLTQEQFTINLNAKNIGSFTWPAFDEGFGSQEPVHVTYKWKRIGGEVPEGWTADLIPTEIRGNSAILPENISWNEETGELQLLVDTPVFPGQYQLIIDTVHEGNAWFGDWGNPTPTYDIQVNSNPDKPLSPPDFGNVLGENEGIGGPVPVPYDIDSDGWGDNCEDYNWDSLRFSGINCFIVGTWQAPRDTGYHAICDVRNGGVNEGHYEYEIVTENDRVFFFCPGNTNYWDDQVGSQVGSYVHWNFPWENSNGGFKIKETFVARKTWSANFYSSDNDSKFFQPIAVNRSQPANEYKFTIQPKYRNTGTQIWSNTNIELVSINKPIEQSGVEVASPFYDSTTWKNSSRIRVEPNSSGYGGSAVVPFTFNIKISDTMPYGIYRQCFVITNTPYENWEHRDSFCINIDVQMTQQERHDYICPQPHAVYATSPLPSPAGEVGPPAVGEVIGYLNQGDSFVIKGKQAGWSLIYFNDPQDATVSEGWIEDDLACFGAAVIIDNIIPAPVFEVLPAPTGDTGYVLRADGINVYKGPDERFPVISHIEYGDQVQVLGEAFIPDNKYGGWLYVRLDKSKCADADLTNGNCEGWVPKGTIWHTNDPKDIQISLVPSMVRVHICGASDVPVYPAPGVKSSTVGTLKPNQNVSIIMTWQNWYQIYLDKSGKTGWVENLNGMCEGFIFPRGTNVCGGSLGYPFEQEWTMTSDFGPRNGDFHDAIDIGAPYGTPILAAESGIVVKAQRDGYCSDNMYGTGLFVDIYHPRLNVTTRYLHLSSANVSVGDEVFKGMIIGKVGNTGCALPRPTQQNPLGGSHLHFGVFDNASGNFVDPKGYLNGGNGGGSCDEINPEDRIVENLAGTPEDHFGGKNQNSLKKPQIRLKITDDRGGITVEVKELNLPAPEITYIDVSDDEDTATVYGVAINKNMKADFKIDHFEKTDCKISVIIIGCIDWNYKYDYREYEDTLDHTGLRFMEQRSIWNGDQEFGWIWNDSSTGRFEYTFNLDDQSNKDINLGDLIYIRSYIWGDTSYDINGVHHSVKIYSNEEKGLESGKSNIEEVRDTEVLIKMKELGQKYSITIAEEIAGLWTMEQLEWLDETFSIVDKSEFSGNTLKIVKRIEGTETTLGSYLNGVLTLSNSTVLDDFGFTKYGTVSPEEYFKLTLMHEHTHVMQHHDGSIASEYAEFSWENITDNNSTDDRRAGATNCDFATGYIPNSWEDMAEAYAVHYIKPSWFRGEYNRVVSLASSKGVWGKQNALGQNTTPLLEVCGRKIVNNIDTVVDFEETILFQKQNFSSYQKQK